MNKEKINRLERKDEYYVNIDKYIYENLTRTQVAFLCLIDKLNKANLAATNKEIGAYLGVTHRYIKRMIQNINEKVSELIKIKYDSYINHKGQIKENNDNNIYRVGRSIHLSFPLHTKGKEYINLPGFSVTKRSQFLSGNELRVFAYIKAMPQNSFTGFLRVMSSKLELSLGIIKRALEKLSKLKAIFRKSIPVHQKLKNIYYTVNTLTINNHWKYIHVSNDEAKVLIKKRRSKYKYEESIEQLVTKINGL